MNHFSGIYGHESIKKLLETAVKTGRIGHAYIFCGPLGVGRYTTARAFAAEAAETDLRQHPDIITVTNGLYGVESKSDSILVDTVTEMRKDIFIKPYSAERKIYIVPKADTMNAASQNKLLKVLEEPPGYCTIIMIAENLNKFLPTILSRVSVVKFSALPNKTVSDFLIDKYGLSDEEAAAKAVMSNGSIGRAAELIDSPRPAALRKETIDSFMELLGSENKNIYKFAKFLKSEKDDLGFIFSVLKSFFEDFVHLKFGLADEMVNVDKTAEMRKLANVVTKRAAVQFLDITLKYERIAAANTNLRISMFCLACEYWEEIHGRDYRSTI